MGNDKRVIVVGAGAAGLMAAGQAAAAGADVLLLEKMDRPAIKLRITGKGRCNLTNTDPIRPFMAHFRPEGRFLRQAFHRFFSDDLRDFFGRLGVPTVVERGGRVFPESQSARDVADALVRWAEGVGVRIWTGAPVQKVIVESGSVIGVRVQNRTETADAVIVATGGASYPGTGSTGDGYAFAEAAGHTVVPVRPALVPLETAGGAAQALQGLSLRNVTVSIWADGRKESEAFGEMVFTHFGISGPIVLTLSGGVVDRLRSGQKIEVSIDLKPALDHPTLDGRLLRDLAESGKRHFQNVLKGLLPSALIPVCIEQTGIPAHKVAHQITADERKRLRVWLKDFRLHVTGHRPFTEAIITAGGVSLGEIDPRTMESQLVKGLYFAGEVVDLDADTGGYNLQAAFSMGWLAGRSAAGK